MRQDLMYVRPEEFDQAFIFFRHCFEIWTVGYEKWGQENYQATFVKDPTVPPGMIMFCPSGSREESVAIKIPKQNSDNSIR